ncbi:MAG: hypothetical protein KatS3mg105_1627 [Gemmatales bacterium]|nr:MAG: hypothetical protein KatS3mg105_1627 [Gemmatales bacterium]
MNARRNAFTLLELLVVVAILAILAGGLIVAYSGLEEQQSHGVAAHTLAGTDRAIRSFVTLNNGRYPNNLDSLVMSDAAAGDEVVDRLHEEAQDKFIVGTLTANEAAQLERLFQEPVIVRDADATLYDNDGNFTNDTFDAAVNNMFDLPVLGGVGVSRTLAAGGAVAMFDTVTPSPEAQEVLLKLRLDPSTYTKAIVFGLSNGSTIAQEGIQGRMPSVPSMYVPRGRYGRLFLVFAVDDNDTGSDAKARFVTVVDAHGHPIDDVVKAYQEP